MPELPEVETIRKVISNQTKGQKILDVKVVNAKTVATQLDMFISNVTGATIDSIDRRGKYFLFSLSTGRMVLHLRLDGQLYVTDADEKDSRFTLITFVLSNGKVLHFDDKRKFAKAYFIYKGLKDDVSGVGRLGYEPFDSRITAEYLKKWWGHQTYTIKDALLDQTVVAGFGNFYSDDLLFMCGIYPKKRCINLTDQDFVSLSKNIPKIMQWGIDVDELSPDEYDKIRGENFAAKNSSYVYGRPYKPCKVCGTKIESMKVAGRTCCYCPKCQPARKQLTSDVVSEVTSDMFAEVAQFVGSVIQTYGSVDTKNFPGYPKTELDPSCISWEGFILKMHEYIATVKKSGTDNEWWLVHSIIRNEDNESFFIGTDWIKAQRWKEF